MARFKDVGEFGFIDRIAGHTQRNRVLCGIGDDCAVMATGNGRVRLVTVDAMVEGVHFVQSAPPESVGYKLLAASLSDVAAMGGNPTDAVVAVAASDGCEVGYVERIYNGLFACADRFDVAVVGGDTTRTSGPLILSLTLTGDMARDRVCYRFGARVGDAVYVSGTLGDAAGGLGVALGEVDMQGEARTALLQRHYRPEARVDLGRALAETDAVTAMIDVSDGVASDLPHICRQSGVSAVIRAEAIPMSRAFVKFCETSRQKKLDLALAGGEDFELLFAVHRERIDRVEALTARYSICRIGEIVAGDGAVVIESEDGKRVPLKRLGYDHFSGSQPVVSRDNPLWLPYRRFKIQGQSLVSHLSRLSSYMRCRRRFFFACRLFFLRRFSIEDRRGRVWMRGLCFLLRMFRRFCKRSSASFLLRYCDRCSVAMTAMPVGRWIARTAVSTLLRC